jgi:hypothetical protein
VTVKEELLEIVAELPESLQQELLRFALSLSAHEERREWREFGLHQLDNAYGEDEPEHTLDDLVS